jgi:hypothetical protein
MPIAGPRGPRLQQALLLVSVSLVLSCGGKWRRQDSEPRDPAAEPPDSSNALAGAPNLPRVDDECGASMENAGVSMLPIRLECVQGLRAIGSGFYRLELASASGESVVLTLASLDSGFRSTSMCTSAVVRLGSTLYIADNPLLPETTATLDLERSGDEFSGIIQGIFQGPVDSLGSMQPRFIFPTVRFAHVPITRPDFDCDCGEIESEGPYCTVPTCDTGCALTRCDAGSTVCAAADFGG